MPAGTCAAADVPLCARRCVALLVDAHVSVQSMPNDWQFAFVSCVNVMHCVHFFGSEQLELS